LLYATDMGDSGKMDKKEKNEMHSTWIRDWEYFVTDNVMTSELLTGEFQGLHLPREIIDKIYSKNARKWLKMFPEDKE